MPSHTATRKPVSSRVMFRVEVALLTTIIGSGAWMGLPGCSSTVVQPEKTSHLSPQQSATNPTGQFGTEAAFRHLVQRTQEMNDRPLQRTSGPRVSDQFPDVVLTSHRNEALHFRSDLVRDRIVCIAMFYTRCTGTCPGTMSKVLALRRSLSEEFGADNLHFVCITLDPDHDDVGALRKFADQLGVIDTPELAQIHLCTGDQQDIDAVRRAVGMYDLDPEIDADRSQHAAMIVTGNDRFNRWAASPAGLKVSDLHETALRIAGETERQRFAARFANDTGFSLTALKEFTAADDDQPRDCCEVNQGAATPSCCTGKSLKDAQD
ncbi:MAG: SCO family protein [Planctomycetaceae bacterium]